MAEKCGGRVVERMDIWEGERVKRRRGWCIALRLSKMVHADELQHFRRALGPVVACSSFRLAGLLYRAGTNFSVDIVPLILTGYVEIDLLLVICIIVHIVAIRFRGINHFLVVVAVAKTHVRRRQRRERDP